MRNVADWQHFLRLITRSGIDDMKPIHFPTGCVSDQLTQRYRGPQVQGRAVPAQQASGGGDNVAGNLAHQASILNVLMLAYL
jgi:hypothetical protein